MILHKNIIEKNKSFMMQTLDRGVYENIRVNVNQFFEIYQREFLIEIYLKLINTGPQTGG
jgi:hypothetical protein